MTAVLALLYPSKGMASEFLLFNAFGITSPLRGTCDCMTPSTVGLSSFVRKFRHFPTHLVFNLSTLVGLFAFLEFFFDTIFYFTRYKI
jgi:hypothetical protein